MKMSKIAKESILLLSLFLIAAMLQFFAESLPMALCFYFLPTLYSAYYFGRRHATLTAFACVFLVVLLDFLNNLMPAHKVLTLPGERLFNFAIWAGVLVVVGLRDGHALRAQRSDDHRHPRQFQRPAAGSATLHGQREARHRRKPAGGGSLDQNGGGDGPGLGPH